MNEKNCPAFARLSIAEKLLDRYGHLHSDLEAARAHLKLMREALDLAHEMLPCTTAVNEMGNLWCSLDVVADGARVLALEGRWQYAGVPLDSVLSGQAPSVPMGAML